MTGELKMLFSSNGMWVASGYGVQGKSLLHRLADLPQFGGKSNIAQFAWYGLQSGMHNFDGFQVYPAGTDPYGNDVIGAHTRHFGANIVISLIDVWVMKDTAQKIAPSLWLPWLPIDHDPVPERVLESLQGAYMPLTYAKWGHDMLKAAGVENHYIPHGIEPTIYRVMEDEGFVRNFKRDVFGEDCKHLTVKVAANKGYPDRKAFQVELRAWAAFAKDKPGAKLYLHTEPTPMYGGVDLPMLCKSLGIAEKVIFPDRYHNYLGFPADYLALLYNAADVYLGGAMAEGFGIPLIEAQACGVPIVTTNFSAMPELVRWGVAVDPVDMFWTPMNAWQAWPDWRGTTEALNQLYEQWDANGQRWSRVQRLKASKAIHDEYSWDSIVRGQWLPLMTKLAEVAPPLQSVEPVQMEQPEPKKPIAQPSPARRKVQVIEPHDVDVYAEVIPA